MVDGASACQNQSRLLETEWIERRGAGRGRGPDGLGKNKRDVADGCTKAKRVAIVACTGPPVHISTIQFTVCALRFAYPENICM
jgi:hypothetical protein